MLGPVIPRHRIVEKVEIQKDSENGGSIKSRMVPAPDWADNPSVGQLKATPSRREERRSDSLPAPPASCPDLVATMPVHANASRLSLKPLPARRVHPAVEENNPVPSTVDTSGRESLIRSSEMRELAQEISTAAGAAQQNYARRELEAEISIEAGATQQSLGDFARIRSDPGPRSAWICHTPPTSRERAVQWCTGNQVGHFPCS